MFHVFWVHSPITRMVFHRCLEEKAIVPSGVVVVGYRTDHCVRGLLGDIRVVARPYRGLQRLGMIKEALRIQAEVRARTRGSAFSVYAAHYLDNIMRILAMSRECKSVNFMEEGLLSWQGVEASSRARGILNNTVDVMGRVLPGQAGSVMSKMGTCYAFLPCAFPDGERRHLMRMSRRTIDLEVDAVVLVGAYFSELDSDPTLARCFRAWVVDRLRSEGCKRFALKFHPYFALATETMGRELQLWHEAGGEMRPSIIEEGMDDVLGEGRLMVGASSSLHVYGSYAGWRAVLPEEDKFHTPGHAEIFRLLQDVSQV